MKQMTCEICSSTEVIKISGIFVCQECGAKYSVEDARNLISDIPDQLPMAIASTPEEASDETEGKNIPDITDEPEENTPTVEKNGHKKDSAPEKKYDPVEHSKPESTGKHEDDPGTEHDSMPAEAKKSDPKKKKIIITVSAVLTIVIAVVLMFALKIINDNRIMAEKIDSANKLESAIKDVYACVCAGTITTDDTNADGSKVTWAAEKNSSTKKRYETANDVTIADVLKYCGYDSSILESQVYGWYNDTLIIAYSEDQTKIDKIDSAISTLTAETTLGALLNHIS